HMRDTRLAPGGERIGPGAPHQHEVGAEREHPHDVETRAYAAIDEDGHAPSDRVSDGRQSARTRQYSVELTPAMIGDDNPVRAGRHGFARVLGIENALDDERPLPLFAHPLDVL